MRNVVPLIALCLLPAGLAHAQSDSELVELFDGTLDDWRLILTEDSAVSVVDGVLRVSGRSGWVRSRGRYENFRLEVEFRFGTDDADSGIFLRADADRTFARGWPDLSYQVQLRNPLGESPFPPVGFLFRHRMPEGAMQFDEAAARRAALPTGEWQMLAIEVAGERVAAWLNGTPVMRAVEIQRSRNFIGIQAESGVLEFRSIRIDER